MNLRIELLNRDIHTRKLISLHFAVAFGRCLSWSRLLGQLGS